jgi:hypothetical protein
MPRLSRILVLGYRSMSRGVVLVDAICESDAFGTRVEKPIGQDWAREDAKARGNTFRKKIVIMSRGITKSDTD